MTASAASSQPDAQSTTEHAIRSSSRLPEPLTSFIGREREVGDIYRLLAEGRTRLVTLTGPGGVGKTRLAIRAAQAAATESGMAVAFVPLASVRDPSLVAATIGGAFGLSDSGERSLVERLSTILRNTPLLLVLDNFEHVVDAALITPLLLGSCPTLKILATSRRPLHVSGEIDYPVPPLATPGPGATREIVEQSPSWRLFVERSPGSARDANSPPQAAESEAIGEICRRLDGLPLAIELAAVRTRVLPPSELLSRLDQRLPLLTDGPVDAPPRLQSLRDAIAWSYDLLSEDEQRLLQRLSVFSGGFTLDAVEAVAPEGLKTPALDLLTRLIDHSLVRRVDDQTGPSRFTMLETVREFALDALKAHDEETAARDRHLHWFGSQDGPLLPGYWFEPRGRRNTTALPGDHDNLRAALSWSLSSDQPGLASHVASGLMEFWWHKGLNAEAAAALKRILDHSESLDPVTRAGITIRLAFFEYVCGNFATARELAVGTLQLCRELDFDLGVSTALHCLGHVSRWSDGSASIQYFDEALRIARSIEDLVLVDSILIQLGSTHMAIGNLGLARHLKMEAIANLRNRQDSPDALAMAQAGLGWVEGLLGNLTQADQFSYEAISMNPHHHYVEPLIIALRVRGNLALERGQYASAARMLKEALQVAHLSSIAHLEGSILVGLAKIAASQGDWWRSATLFGYLDALWDRLDFSRVARRMLSSYDEAFEPSAEAMADAGYRQAFEKGRNLRGAGAFAQGMGVSVPDTPTAGDKALLTRRETEVLAHLAQGKTNQEIAANLFVGKSTVDTHVAHILAKLGVKSRLAAVKAAREQGLLPR